LVHIIALQWTEDVLDFLEDIRRLEGRKRAYTLGRLFLAK